MKLQPAEVTAILKKEIENYDSGLKMESVGTVIQVGDGIARVFGLDNCLAAEMLDFPHGVTGMALNLEEDSVGVVLLGGVTVQLGSRVLDGSIASRLAELRQHLSSQYGRVGA